MTTVDEPLEPGEVRKRELTASEARDQYLRAYDAIAEHKPLLDEAAAVLKPHCKKLKTKTVREPGAGGRAIKLEVRAGGIILDQPKVKTFLGQRLKEFTKRGNQSERLVVVEPVER